jgi:hypothetical protein
VRGADYRIADILLPGWVRDLIGFYEARELVDFDRPTSTSSREANPFRLRNQQAGPGGNNEE